MEVRPRAKGGVVLREEFEDCALLFDPSSGKGFGLDQVGVVIWKLLDGNHSLEEIIQAVQAGFEAVPDDVTSHVGTFIDDLVSEGLAERAAP